MSVIDVEFPGNIASVATVGDLRALPSLAFSATELYVVRGKGLYSWVPGSLALDDGDKVLKPNDLTPLQAGRWLFGPQGTTGPADNTYTTLAALLASDPSRKSARLVPQVGETAAAGNFNYINGAWIRQVADGVVATQDIPGTAVAPLIAKYRQTVSVRDFAGGDPSNDEFHTDAWNAACEAAALYGDNLNSNLMRQIYVPAPRRGEKWRIGEAGKSVYVRRGQHLMGDGIACHVDLTHVDPARPYTSPIIWVGVGSEYLDFDGSQNGYFGDPSGVGTEISSLWFHGCPASCPVIDTYYQAGWWLTKLFFTSNGISIRAAGGDGKIRGCQIDQGLVGIDLDGANINIIDTNIYLLNYGIRVVRAYACTIMGCELEYSQFAGIQIGNGVPGNNAVRGLLIASNTFEHNVPYGTYEGNVVFNATNPRVQMRGNAHRNTPGYAVRRTLGTGGIVSIMGDEFDGMKTNPVYQQSTTMAGIEWGEGFLSIDGCTFNNLPGQPVRMRPAGPTVLVVENNKFIDNTGSSQVEVLVNGSDVNGAVRLSDNVVGGRLLVNNQGTVPVYSQAVSQGRVTLVGGQATIAAPLTRNSSLIQITRQSDGGTVGASYSVSRTVGVGFTITSRDGAGAAQALDTSSVSWSLDLAGV